MNNLQRMIVIPPEIFEKFKHLVQEDDRLSELDKSMKSILHNNKLSDLSKWQLYRQNLIKYSSMKRKSAHQNKFKFHPKINHVEGVAVQTKRIYTKDKDTNTEESKSSSQHTQTEFITPTYQDVGELQSVSDKVPQADEEVFEADSSNTSDVEDDENYIDKSLVRIKRESGGYTTYEMKDGSIVTEPIKNIKKYSVLQKPKDGSNQTTLILPKKKRTITAREVLTRSQSERLQRIPKWTSLK